MLTTPSTSNTKRLRAFALSVLTAGTVLVGSAGTAHADEVSPTAKGIVGGALLGGEVVVFVEGLIGVRSSTAYLVGAGLGAAGGGVGGYFVEQESTDGRVPVYMLAGGLALMIPAFVVALDQTRYLPAEGAREDRPVTDLPPSDPGKPGGSSVIGAEPTPSPAGPTAPSTAPTTAPTTTPPSGTTPATTPPAGGGGGGTPSGVRGPARAPVSLIDVRGRALQVGVPVPEVRPVFSTSQRKALGVESAGNELRFPVLNVTF